MSIENDIKRIADALERLLPMVTAGTAGSVTEVDSPTPAPAKKKKPDGVNAPATCTKEQLADALRECVAKVGHVEAKAILAEYGAARLSEVKAEDIAKCCEALKEKVNGTKAKE